MNRVFFYECKRILLNKMFFGILFINGFFSWYILTTDIILGIGYTAPFSLWSYCTYLGKVMPMGIIAVLLLLANYYGKKQKSVEVLTMATPITALQEMLIRTFVIGICFMIICMMDIGFAFFFYLHFFHFYNFSAFLFPTSFMILPCFLFFLGIGQMLGRLHGNLIYILLFFAFFMGFRETYHAFDLFGAGYISSYPLTLLAGSDGEPDFTVSTLFFVARLCYILSGIVCMAVSIIISKHKPKKA